MTLLFHGSIGLHFGGLILIDSNLFDNDARQLRKAIKAFKKCLEEAGVETLPTIAFICNQHNIEGLTQDSVLKEHNFLTKPILKEHIESL